MRIFKLIAFVISLASFANTARASDCSHFIDTGTQTCSCTGKLWSVMVLKTCRLGETCENTEYSLLGRYCGTDRVTHQNCYLATVSYSCITPPVRASLRQEWSPALMDKLHFEEVPIGGQPQNSMNATQASQTDKNKK